MKTILITSLLAFCATSARADEKRSPPPPKVETEKRDPKPAPERRTPRDDSGTRSGEKQNPPPKLPSTQEPRSGEKSKPSGPGVENDRSARKQ